MNSTSLSIALCTCNGGRFLNEFLVSLAAQSFQPAELVVCDDASSDETVTLLQSFARDSRFPVHIHFNRDRLGVVKNYEQAIELCSGSIIALADQDDVWLSEKLATLARGMTVRTEAVLVFSDAKVVDEALNPFGYNMWEGVGFTPDRQKMMLEDKPWKVLFKDPVVTGANLLFRRELLRHILPIPDGWMHDAWIAQIAASQGRLITLPEPLILYRQHAGNVIGGRKRSFLEQARRAKSLGRIGLVERELKRYSALRDRLASYPATPRRNVMLRMAEEKLAHLESRKRLSSNRLFRWPVVLREYLNGNYRRFAKDWRNVAADLFMP